MSFPGETEATNARLKISTNLLVGNKVRNYKFTVQTIAHVAGKDSLCIVDLSAIFTTKSNSLVTQNNFYNNFYISPNPSSGSIEILFTIQQPSLLHLHIFDELGRDVLAVFDGMVNENRKEFSFKLSPGVYYARMETADGVVTKKVMVE